MTNDLSMSGSFNIGVSGVATNASVTVNQILARSYEYNDLLERITDKKDILDGTAADNVEKIQRVTAQLKQLEAQLEQFKKDVIKLAEQFDLIEINTERLKNAKEYFDKGEIKEAKAVLESELEQMRDEQAKLLEKKLEFEEEILPKLKNNAEEFFMLALLALTDYENEDRFEKTIEYFQRSIESLETKQNLIEYGSFLIFIGKANEAGKQFEAFIKKFAGDMTDEEKAGTFVNFGFYYFNINQYETAKEYLEQALEILETEPAKAFKDYCYIYAAAQGNLAVISQQELKFDEADQRYNQSIASIGKVLDDNYQPNASLYIDTLNNHGYLLMNMQRFEDSENAFQTAYAELERYEQKLGISLPFHLINNQLNYGNLLFFTNEFDRSIEKFENALGVIETFSDINSELYIPNKAMIFNSIGCVFLKQKKFTEAKLYFENAVLQLFDLVRIEPQIHEVNYCIYVINLCEANGELQVEKEISVNSALNVLNSFIQLEDELPYLKKHIERAKEVLKKWGLSEEEISKTLNERSNRQEA